MRLIKFEAKFHPEELNQLFGSKLGTNFEVSVCTDSRVVKSDQIFLPLKGGSFDGHDYINSIFEKFLNRKNRHPLSFCEKKKINKVKKQYRDRLIIVNNTLDAYHKLANHYRKKINPEVVAITGSSGKTTAKDLVAGVLSSGFKVHKTQANFNNEIGVPKTILEMPVDTEVLIIELAMRGKGEIELLSKIAEPDIAVITNVGTAHIGRLGSAQSIVSAKCEILKHLKKSGLAILWNDQKLLKTASKMWSGKTATFDLDQASDITFKDGKTYFTLNIRKLCYEKYSVRALGNIHVLNSLIAILIAKYLGLVNHEIQRGLSAFTIPFGRGGLIQISRDIYLIDESYNANPDSVKAAVDNLVGCWGNGYKKLLVLGELAELGKHEDKLLYGLSKWLKTQELSTVITVGKKLKPFFSALNVKNVSNTDECRAILKKLLTPNSVVLIKGSRVAGLEKVIENLVKNKN